MSETTIVVITGRDSGRPTVRGEDDVHSPSPPAVGTGRGTQHDVPTGGGDVVPPLRWHGPRHSRAVAMMRDTPRTFVGPVVFLLQGPVPSDVAEKVHAELLRLRGISLCELDLAAGTLTVNAQTPVDRTDVVALLDRLGCRVSSLG
ncbi:MAG TPA: hypothetical protein VFG72_06520 [Marmoricola sp.]|nr:hypothetical protein [Marmoricola sp.]